MFQGIKNILPKKSAGRVEPGVSNPQAGYVDPALVAERALGLFKQALESTETAINVLTAQKSKAVDEVAALNQRIIENDAQIGKLTGARAKIAELLGE